MKESVTIKYLHTMFLIVVVFIFQECASEIGWNFSRLFDYSVVDSDGTFMMVSVHHIVMALITLGVMYILHRWKNIEFNVAFKADPCGIKYVLIYCAACLLYNVIWYVVIGFMFDSIAEYNYELSAVNVLGTLGFQLFLSGIEELIFRALPIGCFKAIGGRSSKCADFIILLLTTLLFTIVHINFGIPFSIQWYGLFLVFIQGLIFGIAYLRTKSIVYPMIMHGVSNFVSVGGCYVYMLLSRTI